MTPSIDLMLTTLERALAVTILPAAGNASAKEEATLGILFTRWLRDVVDHAADAERASASACRRALADVVASLEAASGSASKRVAAEAREALARPAAELAADVRDEARRAKALLGRALRAAREDGDDRTALAVRERLFELAEGEIERERAFGRATGMDPDAATLRPLADVLRAHAQSTEEVRR